MSEQPNEAAERLREALNETDWDVLAGFGLDFLDAALAAERNGAYAEGMADGRLVEQENTRQAARATVERIRERLLTPKGYERANVDLWAILDEEANAAEGKAAR